MKPERDDHDELREQVAIGCRILARQDLAHEIAGHVSARIPGTDLMFIRGRSAAERGVRYTTTDAIRQSSFRDASPDDLRYELPLELPIHGEMYLRRDDVNAVVHAHPTYSVLCSVAGVPLEPVYGAYNSGGLRLALEGIPTYPHSRLVDDTESAAELTAAMGDANVCLMRGHGIATVGKDVPDAVMHALQVERLAFFTWQLHLAGDSPGHISDADKDFFAKPYKKSMGQDTGVDTGKERGADMNWRWMSYVAEDEDARRQEGGS